MKKISNILLKIFSIGALLTLFAGALAFFGFIAALIIGGENATAICVFIHKTYFPYVIRLCAISVGFGLIGMYFGKKRALSMDQQKSKK